MTFISYIKFVTNVLLFKYIFSLALEPSYSIKSITRGQLWLSLDKNWSNVLSLIWLVCFVSISIDSELFSMVCLRRVMFIYCQNKFVQLNYVCLN